MDVYERLMHDVRVPLMQRVRYTMEDQSIADIRSAVMASFAASGLAERVPQGGSIAIGVGSRGLYGLPELVKAVVDWFAGLGAHPFIVPCMGSHGGATAEGQRQLLEGLGITAESMGCPVRSCMDVVQVGQLDDFQLPVYMDRLASEADGVFVINRVKLHTTFTGKHESGLIKMMTIGLGKQRGAESCHNLGYAHFTEIMPAMASMILERHPAVLGGLATVENAYDHLCHLEVVPREKMLERDAALLEMSKRVMPSLPLKELDVLLVDRMGKNISGLGMDPNITGRFVSSYKTNDVRIARLGALDLTAETHGGAAGIGCADVISSRLYNKIDFAATYTNVLTSTVLRGAFVPLVMPTDSLVIRAMIKTCNAGSRPVRMMRIRDTLTLGRLLVSPAVAALLAGRDDCELVGDPFALRFDAEGNLDDAGCWTDF
ncbi:MAG TPA: hypothetical protein IAB01_04745 [Candidatus Avidesulfovibrio excrementigallinarum]|nr:hypothetical protein [Candidatus Avidesulfovibrio excrementigallinarum]